MPPDMPADAVPEDFNVATLRPPENLARLRADLQDNADLRKALAEDPTAVFNEYGLSVALPRGTLRRLSLGGGFTIPGRPGVVHADAHVNTHVDVNPHVDGNPHVDIG